MRTLLQVSLSPATRLAHAHSLVGSPLVAHPVRSASHSIRVVPREPSLRTAGSLSETSASSAPTSNKYGGYLDLILCTILWSTYGPAIRYIFASDAVEIDTVTLVTVRGVVASITLAIVVWFAQRNKSQAQPQPPLAMGGQGELTKALSQEGTAAPTTGGASVLPAHAAGAQAPNPVSRYLNWVPSSLLVAGIEIGFWNQGGTALEASGLVLTSATRGSFLLQLSALIVPLICVLGGEMLSVNVLAAVAIGFSGILMITFDGMPSASEELLNVGTSSGGDTLILGACFFYSMALIRIGKFANTFDAVELTAMEKVQGTLMAAVWLGASRLPGLLGAAPDIVTSAVPASSEAVHVDPMAVALFCAVVAFTAIGPGCWASVLQTQGMRLVPATQSQLIFSTTPLLSAAIAAVTVGQDGSESMGALSWVGAALIVASTLVASQKDEAQEGEGEEEGELVESAEGLSCRLEESSSLSVPEMEPAGAMAALATEVADKVAADVVSVDEVETLADKTTRVEIMAMVGIVAAAEVAGEMASGSDLLVEVVMLEGKATLMVAAAESLINNEDGEDIFNSLAAPLLPMAGGELEKDVVEELA